MEHEEKNVQLASEKVELSRMQSFGKYIIRLQGTANVLRNNEIHLKRITGKMTVDLDVLHAFMKDRVGDNIKCSLTVTGKWNRLGNRNMKVLKKPREPFKFTQGNNHGAIIDFGRRPGDNMLLFYFPKERRTTKENIVTSNRTMSDWTVCPIGITIRSQEKRGISPEKKTLSRNAFKKLNHTKGSSSMILSRSMHKWSKDIDIISKVEQSVGQVNQLANQATVPIRISIKRTCGFS